MQISGSLYPAGLVDLPWNRVGVWAVVVWFMYSLKDFFGVSPSHAEACTHYSLMSSTMCLAICLSCALKDLGGHADCHGDLRSLFHWEWLCKVCPEGSPLSSPDIAPDPAEDPGIALCMRPLHGMLAVNAHNAVGKLSMHQILTPVVPAVMCAGAGLLCSHCVVCDAVWRDDHPRHHPGERGLCDAAAERQHLGCGAGEAAPWPGVRVHACLRNHWACQQGLCCPCRSMSLWACAKLCHHGGTHNSHAAGELPG